MLDTSNIEKLFSKSADYAETRINIIKLKSIDKSSDLAASMAWRITVYLFIITSLIFFNIGLAVWLGEILNHFYYGFFVVGLFYLLIGFILFKVRTKLIKAPLKNLIIRKFTN
jgi:hypothetical protein